MFYPILKKMSALFVLLLLFSSNVFAAEDKQSLYLEEAYETSPNTIMLVFSNPISEKSLLDDGSIFKIEDKSNLDDYYEVIKKELDQYDNNMMVLTLSQDMVDGREYKVTVLKVEDIYGQNIVFGVDSEASFVFKYLPQWSESGTLNNNNGSLNSGEEKDNSNETNNTTNENMETNTVENNEVDEDEKGSIAGVNLNAGDVENQVDVVATDNTKLPQAGPEHIILLFLALVLGGSLFVYRYKKL